jgi:hypothetical protein
LPVVPVLAALGVLALGVLTGVLDEQALRPTASTTATLR